jgi:Uma2 family endonuclease
MTLEDNEANVSDMAAAVTRSPSPISAYEWDELTIPESYRAEIIQGALVVRPAPEWLESATAPPISLREWREVTVPESYRAEIVQSELIVSPAASYPHGRVQAALLLLLDPLVPDGYEVLINMEWLYEERGHVAIAPQPDVIVTPVGINELRVPPLFAVEVISPSDGDRLQTGSKLTRLEGKRLDYATNGLTDYLEVELASGRPVVVRFEIRDGVLVEVDRAEGDKPLVADRPFPYKLVPERLLAR